MNLWDATIVMAADYITKQGCDSILLSPSVDGKRPGLKSREYSPEYANLDPKHASDSRQRPQMVAIVDGGDSNQGKGIFPRKVVLKAFSSLPRACK